MSGTVKIFYETTVVRILLRFLNVYDIIYEVRSEVGIEVRISRRKAERLYI